MFEKLVVSSVQTRKGRTAKFFVCTSFIYLSAVGVAFALSVLLATPKLADTAAKGPEPIFFSTAGPTRKTPGGRQPRVAPARDPRNVEPFEKIIGNLGNPTPPIMQIAGPPGTEKVGAFELPSGDGGPGLPGMPSTPVGVSSGNVITDPPRPPDPPKPQRAPERSKPLLVSSTVLQGKAVERVVPIYPELARRTGLKGQVSIEVIISPAGQVESARVVSGHALLVSSARDAARRWRFEPTFLNGVAVRVTGVITFVFKLNE